MTDIDEAISAEALTHHEPLTPEDLELLATPDEDLANKVSDLCFDYDQFTCRVFKGDRWQQLLQAHLYFDHVITRMLEEALPNPDAIKLRRTSFSQKVQLISAMNLLPSSLIPPVEFINGLRNKIAHELNFEISDDAVNNLINCTPKRLRQVALEQCDREDGPLSFHEVLHIVLIQIETFRQDHVNQRLLKRKHVLNARVVLAKAAPGRFESRMDRSSPRHSASKTRVNALMSRRPRELSTAQDQAGDKQMEAVTWSKS